MTNEKQVAYWNEIAGPKWVKIADEMDQRFAEITQVLLARADIPLGAKILDVGCGTGSVAALFAQRAGSNGSVTGIDISEPMLDVARAAYRDLDNLTFLKADAQIFDFHDHHFDFVVSRFGVMFFDDPVSAFKNLASALKPGGRLCFVCWAPLSGNLHWKIPFDIAVEELGPPDFRPARAPGPMALADHDYIKSILTDAGLIDIHIQPTSVQIIGQNLQDETRIALLLGPSGSLLDEKKADQAVRETVGARIKNALEQFDGPGGIRLPATVYFVTARK